MKNPLIKKAVDLKGGSEGLVNSKLLVDEPLLGCPIARRIAFQDFIHSVTNLRAGRLTPAASVEVQASRQRTPLE